MANHPNYLLPTDLPKEMRPYFDFGGQETRGKRKQLHILRACISCDRKDWLIVSNIRRRAGLGVTSRCQSCNALENSPYFGTLREGSPAWKGGRHKVDGYILVWNSDTRKYQGEHRLVMETLLERPLVKGENVHHLNGIRDDNRPENLELWAVTQPVGIRARDYHCPGCRCGEGGDNRGAR